MRRLLVCLLLLLSAAPVHADVPLARILRLEDARDGTALLAMLSSPDPATRARVVRALGRIQDPALVDTLAELAARDGSPLVRAEAIFALGQEDVPEAADRLLNLAPRSAEERLLVLGAVGRTAPLTGLGHARLLKALEADDPAVRAAALAALEDFAWRHRKGSPVWSPTADDVARVAALLVPAQPAAVRSAAAGVLWRLAWLPPGVERRPCPWAAEALRVLVPAITDSSPEVRMRALAAIGEVCAGGGSPGVELPGEVGRALGDRDWRVRVSAAEAIARAAPDRAWPLLLEEKLGDRHPLVVLASLRALETFAKRYGKTSPGRGIYPVYLRRDMPLQVRAEALRIAVAFQAFDGLPAPQPFGPVGPAAKPAKGSPSLPRDVRTPPVALPAWAGEWRFRRALVEGSVENLEAAATSGKLDGALLVGQYQAVVRPFLADRDARVRTATVEALGELGSKAGRGPLLQAIEGDALGRLSDPDTVVRCAAADLLAARGVEAAVGPILDTLEGLRPGKDVEVMTSLIDDLRQLRDRRATPLLERFASDSDPTLSKAAARALGAITGQPTIVARAVGAPPEVPPEAVALAGRTDRRLHAIIHTSRGDMTLLLFPDEAPLTVYNFIKLARARYFDGLTFHRVVPNFVVQGGDPRGDGWGGPGYTIRCEYNPLTYGRGTVGMALAGKDTGGSQFFITHSPQPRLNGRYTIFAQLVEGGEVLDRLTEGDTMKVEIVDR
jgi:cyclophilin family peptidyl-prolyl cis-trans isomerase/HEAT repeat protein